MRLIDAEILEHHIAGLVKIFKDWDGAYNSISLCTDIVNTVLESPTIKALVDEKDVYYPKDMKALYECDRTKCDDCSEWCTLTTNIIFAKSEERKKVKI